MDAIIINNIINEFTNALDNLQELTTYNISLELQNILIKYFQKGNKGEKGENLCIKNMLLNKNIKELFKLEADIDAISRLNKTMIKSPALEKADCYIKLVSGKIYYVSIKCFHGGNPTLLNHTPRSANVFQNGDLKYLLPNLDEIIILMNKLRMSKEVSEDIKIQKLIEFNNNQNQPIVDLTNTLKKVVEYFIFEGTGSRKSKYTINAVLIVLNPENINTWKFYKCDGVQSRQDYVDLIFDKLILSIRDKGMPTKKDVLDLCQPWIFNNKEKIKGSLHIRLAKF